MHILEKITDQEVWWSFLEDRIKGGHLAAGEAKELEKFIEAKEYLPVVTVLSRKGPLPVPYKKMISKMRSGKKRTVYLFDKPENQVFKLISWLLQEYDGLFTDNLYSFRKNRGVRQAVRAITSVDGIDGMWSLRLDIHDYFNSVDVALLLPMLKRIFAQDPDFFRFLCRLLENSTVLWEGRLIQESKGIMAGVPISSFLANVYLMEMDRYFQESGVIYARYSDDVILFAREKEELEEYAGYIRSQLEQLHLCLNESKTRVAGPHEAWSFLGIAYRDGEVDLADSSVEKLKGKMKRKARALYRWKKKKKATDERALRCYFRYFNRKLFDNPIHSELTWCRWFFPLINTDESLRELDRYMISCARYLASGHYSKSGYSLRYQTLKEYGFRSLVHAYYGRTEGEEKNGRKK